MEEKPLVTYLRIRNLSLIHSSPYNLPIYHGAREESLRETHGGKKKTTLEEVAEKVDGEGLTCTHFSLYLPFLLSTDRSLFPARMQAQEEFYLAHQSIPKPRKASAPKEVLNKCL